MYAQGRRCRDVAMQADCVTSTASTLAVANLVPGSPNRFRYRTTREDNIRLADEIGAIRVNHLVMTGRVEKVNSGDWHMQANLHSTVVQQCVATLQHLTTNVRSRVTRTYVRDRSRLNCQPDHMIPEDDNLEQVDDEIDIYALAREVLVLELPSYPRSGNVRNIEIGIDATGQDRPLSGLAEIYRLLKD